MKILITATIWTLLCGFIVGVFCAGMMAGYDLCLWERPLTVRRIQIELTLTGYDCGPIDDVPGPKFRAAYMSRINQQYFDRVMAKMPKEGE